MDTADLYDEANVGDVKEKKMKKKANSGTTTREPTTDISNPSIPVERPRVSHTSVDECGDTRFICTYVCMC